ncbi:MAG: hypothetical protein ACKOB6_01845, partial [Candidatus Kapaibacterium sp.]
MNLDLAALMRTRVSAVLVTVLLASTFLHAQTPFKSRVHREREFEHEQEMVDRAMHDLERSADPSTGSIP